MKDNIFPLYTLNKISNSICPHYNVQVVSARMKVCTSFAPKYLQKKKKNYAIDAIVRIAINKLAKSETKVYVHNTTPNLTVKR